MAGLLVGAGGPAGLGRGRARRDRPADPRRRLAARPARRTTPSTRAPTSCSPGSSARSTRTATATPTTPPGSRSSRSSSRSPRSPTARSRARSTGALRLDTLVVAAAGNDGPAGPAFGSIGGPGRRAGRAHGRRGRRAAGDAPRCASSSAPGSACCSTGSSRSPARTPPQRTLLLSPAAPRGPAPSAQAFFDDGLEPRRRAGGRRRRRRRSGRGRALGRAGRRGRGAPARAAGRARRDRARRADRHSRCSSVPDATARALARAAGPRSSRSPRRGRAASRDAIAPFSSWGLAFDGGVKPELLAPGVGLVTAEPGRAADGGPPSATVSGSSAAAAVVAGRRRAARRGAARRRRARRCARCSSAAATRLAARAAGRAGHGPARPRPLGARRARRRPADAHLRPRQRRRLAGAPRSLRLRNVSTRRLTVFVATGQRRDARASGCRLAARRLEIEPGAVAELAVRTRPITIARGEAALGRADADAGRRRAACASRGRSSCARRADLLGPLAALARGRSSRRSSKPAVVVVRAGRVAALAARERGRPGAASRRRAAGPPTGKRLGLLARLRDLLPGPLRVRPHRPRPRRQACSSRGALPPPGLRLADRRRPADLRSIRSRSGNSRTRRVVRASTA